MTSCIWLSLAFSALFTSQVVYSATLHSTEVTDTENHSDRFDVENVGYQEYYAPPENRYADDLETLLDDRELSEENFENAETYYGDNNPENVPQDGYNERKERESQVYKPARSLLDEFYSYINGEDINNEEQPKKKHNKREYYSNDMYESRPLNYESRYPRYDELYGYSDGDIEAPSHKYYRQADFSEGLKDDEECEDCEDERNDDDDEEEEETDDGDDDADNEDDDDEDEDDEDDEEDDDAKDKPEQKVEGKSSNDGNKNPLFQDIDEDSMKAFSKFVDNLVSEQLKVMESSGVQRTAADNLKIIDAAMAMLAEQNITRIPSDIPNRPSLLLNTIINNNRSKTLHKTDVNPQGKPESNVHIGGDKINRVARQVVTKEPGTNKTESDDRTFVHVRKDKEPKKEQKQETKPTEEEEHSYIYDKYYKQFLEEHPQEKISDNDINDDYHVNYNFQRMKNKVKAFKGTSESSQPIVLIKVHDLKDNDQTLSNESLDKGYAKYKRDLEHVTSTHEPQDVHTDTDTEINNTTQMEVKERPIYDKPIVFESVSINTIPYYTIESYQGNRPTNVFKINDVIEHGDVIKEQIEMMPYRAFTHLVESFLYDIPATITNHTEQDGTLVNVYADTPRSKQKRDLRNRREDESSNNYTQNTINSLENMIAYQLSQCPEIRDENLSESERKQHCKEIISKVLANVSDDQIVKQIVKNNEPTYCSECKNEEMLPYNEFGVPYCYGEANDDYEKTFINIKNLNIFYEFGETGQNCITIPHKRVQYALPCSYPPRRTLPISGNYQGPVQHIIPQRQTVHRQFEPEVTILPPLPENIHVVRENDVKLLNQDDIDFPEKIHVARENNVKLLNENDIDLHQNAYENEKVAHKREYNISNDLKKETTDYKIVNETNPHAINSDIVYSNNNITTFHVEEQKPVIVSHDSTPVITEDLKANEEGLTNDHTVNHINQNISPVEENTVNDPSNENKVLNDNVENQFSDDKSFQLPENQNNETEIVDEGKSLQLTGNQNETSEVADEVKDIEPEHEFPVNEEPEPEDIRGNSVNTISPHESKTHSETPAVSHDNATVTNELLDQQKNKDDVIRENETAGEITVESSIHDNTSHHIHNSSEHEELTDFVHLRPPVEPTLENVAEEINSSDVTTIQPAGDTTEQSEPLIADTGSQVNYANESINEEVVDQTVSVGNPENQLSDSVTDNIECVTPEHKLEEVQLPENIEHNPEELECKDERKQTITEGTTGQEEENKTTVPQENQGTCYDFDDNQGEPETVEYDENNKVENDVLLEERVREHKDDVEKIGKEMQIVSIEEPIPDAINNNSSVENQTKSVYLGETHIVNSTAQMEDHQNKTILTNYLDGINLTGEEVEKEQDNKEAQTNDNVTSEHTNMKYKSIAYKKENTTNKESTPKKYNGKEKKIETFEKESKPDKEKATKSIDKNETTQEQNHEKVLEPHIGRLHSHRHYVDYDEDKCSTAENNEDNEKHPHQNDNENKISNDENDQKENNEEETLPAEDEKNTEDVANVEDKEEPEQNYQNEETTLDQPEDTENQESKRDIESDVNENENKAEDNKENVPEEDDVEPRNDDEPEAREQPEDVIIDMEKTREANEKKNEDNDEDADDNKNEFENNDINDVEETENDENNEDDVDPSDEFDIDDDADEDEPEDDVNVDEEDQKEEEEAQEDQEVAEEIIEQEEDEADEDSNGIHTRNDPREENNAHFEKQTRNDDLIEEQYKENQNHDQKRTVKSANVHESKEHKVKESLHSPEELNSQDETQDYVKKSDVEKLILEILESKPHPDHDKRHKHMYPNRPDKKYKELVKDIASYFAKKNITSGDDICVYEEYGSKRGEDDVIILSGTKLYQNGVTKKDGQNFNLIIKKPHDTKPLENEAAEQKSLKGKSKIQDKKHAEHYSLLSNYKNEDKSADKENTSKKIRRFTKS